LLELIGAEPESPEQARAALRACTRIIFVGVMLGLEFARGEALYRRGRTLAAQLDDPNLETGLIGAFARLANFSGAYASALEAAQEALVLMPRVSDPRELGEVCFAAANQLGIDGRNSDALAVIDAVLAGGKVNESTPVPLARVLSIRGVTLSNLGRLPEAQMSLDRAAELLADKGQVLYALTTDIMRSHVSVSRSSPAGSLEFIARLVARADEAGSHLTRVQARGNLAQVHLLAGQPDEALALIEVANAIANETRAGMVSVVFNERVRVQALLARSDVAAARAAADRLIASTDTPPFARTGDLLVYAEVLIASDAAAERGRIEASLAEADAIAQRTGNLSSQAWVCRARAQIARALGDEAGRQRELREALRIYTQMGATVWVERVTQELAP
jgi:tetratricopeptide (TPR) repeat protein